jgi:hypothetical protein
VNGNQLTLAVTNPSIEQPREAEIRTAIFVT